LPGRRAKASASGPRRRGRRSLGVIAAGTLATGAALVGYLAYSSSQPQQLTSADIGSLERALSTTPTADAAGADLSEAARPPGFVRTYFFRQGPVTTVIYTGTSSVESVRQALDPRLIASGWAAGSPSAGSSTLATTIWEQVYTRANSVLQVRVQTRKGVTSTTFILESL
jgi:hypothetical protein